MWAGKVVMSVGGTGCEVRLGLWAGKVVMSVGGGDGDECGRKRWWVISVSGKGREVRLG